MYVEYSPSADDRNEMPFKNTGWRRLIGCLKLHVIFRKRATSYRALLRKMTYGIRHPRTLRHRVPPLYLVRVLMSVVWCEAGLGFRIYIYTYIQV